MSSVGFRGGVAALLLLGAAGCTGVVTKDSDGKAAEAEPLAGAPKVGTCYRLSDMDVCGISSEAEPVPCDGRHNSYTYHVGMLEVGSGETPGTFARRECRGQLPAALGLPAARVLSTTFDLIAFRPSAQEGADGAAWYRCDLITHGLQWGIAPLPEGTPPYYAGSRLPDRYLNCVNARIPNNLRIPCDRPHTHRWVASFEAPLVMPTSDELNTLAQRCRTMVRTLSWYWTAPDQNDWISGLNRISCYEADTGSDSRDVTASPPDPV